MISVAHKEAIQIEQFLEIITPNISIMSFRHFKNENVLVSIWAFVA